MTVGDKVNGVLAHTDKEVDKDMDGFGLTLTFTDALCWHLFMLVTVTEMVTEAIGLRVMAEEVAPVLHLNKCVEALNFVSSVTEFDWQTSTEVGRLITGFGTIAIEVEEIPVQPVPSVTVTE